jgi:hypothetical protein
MTTINQYISDLRGIIKESGRSADVYTDQFLYSLLNGARAYLLEQQSSKLDFQSEWDWQQFPLKLVKDKSHLVGCVTVGCDILRTEYKVPRPITSRIKNMMDVTTFDYSTILLSTEQAYRNAKYDDIKSQKTMASVINNYIIIWNKPELKSILVNGLWENLLDWTTIPQCDNSGNYTTATCFDALNSEFKIGEDLKHATYDIVLKKLFPTLDRHKDITNDSNAEIKA